MQLPEPSMKMGIFVIGFVAIMAAGYDLAFYDLNYVLSPHYMGISGDALTIGWLDGNFDFVSSMLFGPLLWKIAKDKIPVLAVLERRIKTYIEWWHKPL